MPSPSIAPDAVTMFYSLMSQPERYWPVLMTVSESERHDLETTLDQLAKTSLDARDPGFRAVFPTDILAQGKHLVFFWFSQTAVKDAAVSYKGRFLGRCRRTMIGLPFATIQALDTVLAGFLSDPEKSEYERVKRTPGAFIRFSPKPNSYALWVVQGIYPE